MKLEDCSGMAFNNTIVGNVGSGIDCVNARDITTFGNTVQGNRVGVSVRPYNEESLIRGFSPLLEEDAGVSSHYIRDNFVEDNECDWYVEEGCSVVNQTG